MYQCILFDLDGTLTDSGEGITKSVQYALEKIGHPEPDLDKLRVFVGPPLLEQFMTYAGVDADTARQAVAYYRERYSPIGIFENELYPGITAMLRALKARGYSLSVASSKPEMYVIQILDYFGIKSYFDVIAGSEMNGRRTTKSEVIEEALERLDMADRREEVLMVGDREHDVFGARQCGLECVAVSYGYGSEEELTAASPLKIVHSAGELIDFFELTPLKKQTPFQKVWRVFSPLLLFFAVSQLISSFVIMTLSARYADYASRYLKILILVSGIVDLVTMIPAWRMYKRDQRRREYGRLVPNPAGVRLTAGKGVLLLLMGASVSYYGNILTIFLTRYLDPQRFGGNLDRAMEGRPFWILILWVGIVAPFAEEIIFRWHMYLRLRDYMGIWVSAILTAAIFGVYHRNLLQGIYAFFLGLVAAYILEMTGNRWSSLLVHAGANTFSLIVNFSAAFLASQYGSFIYYYAVPIVLLALLILGIRDASREGKARGYRAL